MTNMTRGVESFDDQKTEMQKRELGGQLYLEAISKMLGHD
jgi:hypothetical protein